MATAAPASAAGAGLVLMTLASGQFLMTLDSSVMNVSIATVADDVGTTVTGIQTAITLYTLVMATTMIAGGKIGTMIGRRRAFSFGCVIYGAGSLTTALAPNVVVLYLGWSLLEGLGAALIMPAIVALIATNFPADSRPRAYGLVAAAGAIAVAAGPLIGGFMTTYLSWRYVFAGEVVVVVGILALSRRIVDEPAAGRSRFDVVGATLSSLGLGLAVYAVLRSGTWGWVSPRSGAPALLGVSAVVWLLVAAAALLRLFVAWESRVAARGGSPLVRLDMLRNAQLRGGLTLFFLQFLVQSGTFFVVPLFLSVVLGLSAFDTGLRLVPLSVALLVAAVGIPKLLPSVSPRRIVQSGLALLSSGLVVLIAALDAGAGPEIVSAPLLLAGLGIGALASQLGAVTVSAVPDEMSGEVGGLQNTLTNLGASVGTALAGSVMIAALTASFLTGVRANPEVPAGVVQAAELRLAGGAAFLSNVQLEEALAATDLDAATVDAIVDENEAARITALRTSLFLVAMVTLAALFLTQRIPAVPVGAGSAGGEPELQSG